jgi:hypothetical protein
MFVGTESNKAAIAALVNLNERVVSNCAFSSAVVWAIAEVAGHGLNLLSVM